MIVPMPVLKTIITYQIKLKNGKVKIHQHNKHFIRQLLILSRSGWRAFVTLIQRCVSFLNVRVSYITFTATAVLPQITKPLPRYGTNVELVPIPANTAVFHVQCIPITAVDTVLPDVPIPVQLSTRHWKKYPFSGKFSKHGGLQECMVTAVTIDNRIYNSRLNNSHHLRRRKCHQNYNPTKWRTLKKTSCYWAEE